MQFSKKNNCCIFFLSDRSTKFQFQKFYGISIEDKAKCLTFKYDLFHIWYNCNYVRMFFFTIYT